MEVYVVEFRNYDEIETREFLVSNLLELFEEVNRWQRRECIHDDSIISIEEG